MRWFWALILILAGILLLGLNLNWWNQINWSNIALFWPLILIILGISLIFNRFKWGWIVIFIFVIGGLLIIFDSLISSKPIIFKNISQNIETNVYPFQENFLDSYKEAIITLDSSPGKITISDSSDFLVQGTFEGGYQPEISVYDNQGIISTNINTNSFKRNAFLGWNKNNLTLKITNKIPVKIIINTGASDLNMDLTNITLAGLETNSGASTITIRVGNVIQDKTNIDIEAGASTITVNIPKDIGVNLEAKTGVSSKNFKNYKKISDNLYQSSSYDSSTIKVNLLIKAGASTLNVNEI